MNSYFVIVSEPKLEPYRKSELFNVSSDLLWSAVGIYAVQIFIELNQISIRLNRIVYTRAKRLVQYSVHRITIEKCWFCAVWLLLLFEIVIQYQIYY